MTNPYDLLEYPSHCQPQTHPDRLATLATLMGMLPAGEECRVLELGCGDGLNLVAIAVAMPESRCLGIDLAERPIARGQDLIRRVGLTNVSLERRDLTELTGELGQFDFIIAHGLYSWVPAGIRDKLLHVFRQNLAPQGIAYVSYNSNPGGHLRQMCRRMMLFHVRHIQDSRKRVAEALNLLRFLVKGHQKDHPIAHLLQGELERLGAVKEAQVFHDDLAAINEPVYFDQFIEHAAAHDLQFLAEAELELIGPEGLPEWVQSELARLSGSDIVAREMYMDFLRDRTFRQTLLCHAGVKLSRPPAPANVRGLFVASSTRPVSPQPELRGNTMETFKGPTHAQVSTSSPLAKAALVVLSELWPAAVTFDNLLESARSRAQVARADTDADYLAQILLSLCAGGLLQFHARPRPVVLQPADRPLASPLARVQSETGDSLTTLLGETMRVEVALGRRLVQLLDGTRDRAALLTALSDPPAPASAQLRSQLESKLTELGIAGVLIR